MGFGVALSLAARADVDPTLVNEEVTGRFNELAETLVTSSPVSQPPSQASSTPSSEPVALEVFGSAIPELTPSNELSLAPESKVNFAYAPNVPPTADRVV